MKAQQLFSQASQTEMRFASRSKEREEKLKEAGTHDLTKAETPRRIAARAARLGVSSARALELMQPGAISIDPAELGFERVLGRKDFVHLDYLERGTQAARSVCRVVIRSSNGSVVGFGTGFLVAPRVMITNNHVLGSSSEARDSLIEFNFQRKLDGSLERVIAFALRPQELFLTDIALDFTIVAVADASGTDRLDQFAFLPLLAAEGKVNVTEAVNIIQHPDGEEKQLALRENEVIDLLESFIHYRTDTAPGSSGSPVLNDQWEVVALHHSGVPARDAQGRILAINGQPWRQEMGESRVKWIANEGVRVSRILNRIQNANLTSEQRSLLALDIVESMRTRTSAGSVPVISSSPEITTSSNGDELLMKIPVTLSIRLGVGDRALRAPDTQTPTTPIPPTTPSLPPREGIDGAVDEARRLLSGVSNVIDVRKGWKFRDGWITDERAVIVVVKEKISETELKDTGREPLPGTIGGFPVDVRPAGPLARLGQEGLALAERFGLEVLRKPRIRYQSPARADQLLAPFHEKMRLVAHASPDAGFPQLSAFINRIDKDLRVAMFDFGAPHIVDALVRKLKPAGHRMQITIQPGESLGGATKADDLTDEASLERLRNAMHGRFTSGLIRPSTAGGFVASSYHIKVAVRDAEEFWLSSGNWQSSNQPDKPRGTKAQQRTLLNNFNREWHVIAQGDKISETLKVFLDHDFATGPAPEDVEALMFPVLVELPEVVLPPELEAAREVRLFDPLVLEDEEVNVQVALTPDNYSQVALSLIESAESKIFFENQSFKILDENDEHFEALLNSLLAKQRAGLDVRIIFRDIGDVQESLEKMKDFGFDMDQVKLHPHCHTKGIVVDGSAVLVGSHNWTNHGTVFNRDASLLIKNTKVAKYFEDLFLFDWENMARQQTMFERFVPRIIRPEEAREAKGRVVSLAEYLGEE